MHRWCSGGKLLCGSNEVIKKKAAVGVARQLLIDIWKMRTGRTTAQELGLILNLHPALKNLPYFKTKNLLKKNGFGKRRVSGFALGQTLAGRLGALACLDYARIKHNVSRARERRTRIAGWTVEG